MSDKEKKFKRWLYFCSEEPRYIVNCQPLYFFKSNNIRLILDLVDDIETKNFVEIMTAVNKDHACSRRETLLYALAVCCRVSENEELRNAAYDLVLQVCKTTEELFTFVKMCCDFNKNFPHRMKRVLCNYYSKFEQLDLTGVLTHKNSFHGWTHKDMFKMMHIKPKTPHQEIMFAYIAQHSLESAKKKVGDEPSKMAIKTIDTLEHLEKLKKCEDEVEATDIIRKYKFSLQHVSPSLNKNHAVWEELIKQMKIPELINHLRRINKIGLLKPKTATLKKTVEVLTDYKKCLSCKIHPVEVFIGMKLFERGKPLDPQKRLYLKNREDNNARALPLPTKYVEVEKITGTAYISPVIQAFQKLLQNSYRNIYITKRRVFIAVAFQKEYITRICFPNKNIAYVEAISVFILSFLNAEKDVIVGVFNGPLVNTVVVEKGMTPTQIQQKLHEVDSGFVFLSSPMQWASTNKRPVDVFINCIFSSDALNRIPRALKPKEPVLNVLKRYKKTVRLPNTKMITIAFGSPKLSIADGSPYVFDICGFDGNIMKVIQGVCKGTLQ